MSSLLIRCKHCRHENFNFDYRKYNTRKLQSAFYDTALDYFGRLGLEGGFGMLFIVYTALLKVQSKLHPGTELGELNNLSRLTTLGLEKNKTEK